MILPITVILYLIIVIKDDQQVTSIQTLQGDWVYATGFDYSRDLAWNWNEYANQVFLEHYNTSARFSSGNYHMYQYSGSSEIYGITVDTLSGQVSLDSIINDLIIVMVAEVFDNADGQYRYTCWELSTTVISCIYQHLSQEIPL